MRLPFAAILATLTLLCASLRAGAWSEYNLGLEFADADINSNASIAIGSNGNKYVVFGAMPNGGDGTPRLYLKVVAGDIPGPAMRLPGPDVKTPEAVCAVDSHNVVHIVGRFRPDGAVLPYSIYYWTYDNGVWTGPTLLSPGVAPFDTNAPRIAIDRFDTVHVVWSEQGHTNGAGDLMYKRRVNGVWQATQNITNNFGVFPYGSNYPDIAVDAAGTNVHVVWHDEIATGAIPDPAGGKRAWYMKNTSLGEPGYWQTPSQWQEISTDLYGANPYIALDNNDRPSCIWMGRTTADDSGYKYLGYRRWTGAAWTAEESFGSWNWTLPCRGFDTSNIFHYMYTDSSLDGRPLLYHRTYNPATGALSAPEMVCGYVHTQKVYNASMAYDRATGYFWAVWKARVDPVINGYGKPSLFIASNAPSGQAPDPVSSFEVTSVGDGKVSLRWTNPSGISFAGTMIRYKTGGYPSSATDGTLACDRSTLAGQTDSFVVTGLTNGTVYYFTAFAHDNTPVYAAGVNTSATPVRWSCAEMKEMPDGYTAELSGKVVTAVFAADGAVYVEDASRASGIRVIGSGTGLVPGDIVDVTGALGTRKLNGVASERQIQSATISKVSPGSELRPLSMGGSRLGGEANPPYAPGVQDGVGLNNMGLLVRTWGKVTAKAGAYFWIDDGAHIADSGHTGVMVKCPDINSPVVVGDYVSVTGILEGSIPSGGSANRREVRIRTYADIQTLAGRP